MKSISSLIFVLLVCVLGYSVSAAPAQTYSQPLEITFKTAQAAKNAKVEILPLYNGYTWAISSRWDDNNINNLKMRDTLAKHGHKGTFYLNSTYKYNHWRPTGNVGFDTETFTDTAKELLKGGNSIGGHSLSHPFLTYVNRNRIFEELAGIRAEWEAALDIHILSYAFSFGDYWNLVERRDVQADIDQALKRAGFYHIAERATSDFYNLSRTSYSDMPTDMILSWIAPSDGKDIKPFMEKALADEALRKKSPNLSYSMHVWYETPEAWAKFESQLDDYGHNPNYWYCNQNQYAAYRYQFLNSKLSDINRTENTITVTLRRPNLLTVNDPTPLTLAVKGIEPEQILSVNCPTTRTTRKTNSNIFNLYHDNNQNLPEKIGLSANKENQNHILRENPDFPGLKALLYFDNGKLNLTIDNQTTKALKNIRITFRLPLAYKEGIVVKKTNNLPPGKTINEKLTPTLSKKDYKYNAGSYFFATQLDFTLAGKPGRIHATCNVKNNINDNSYPQGGFLKLGPIPPEQLDIEKLLNDISSCCDKPWKLADGSIINWHLDPKGNPFDKPYLNVEVVRTSGRWKEKPRRLTYILQTFIYSPKKQPVKFLYLKKSAKLLLNGQEVTGKEYLNKGDNHLVIISSSRYEQAEFPDQRTAYKHDYKSESAGCFLRLVNPDTNKRLKNIKFVPKTIEKTTKTNKNGFFSPSNSHNFNTN